MRKKKRRTRKRTKKLMITRRKKSKPSHLNTIKHLLICFCFLLQQNSYLQRYVGKTFPKLNDSRTSEFISLLHCRKNERLLKEEEEEEVATKLQAAFLAMQVC